jgi:hypothetical protein
MAERSPQSKPANTRIDGATNGVAFNRIAPAVETIQAFAREDRANSVQALVRTNQHVEKLRNKLKVTASGAVYASISHSVVMAYVT